LDGAAPENLKSAADSQGLDAWERQPKESSQRFAAFTAYRDQPAEGRDRSLRAVARRLDKSYTLVSRWSREDGWQRRIAAYDRHLDASKRAGRTKELEEQSVREGRQLAGAAASLAQPIVAYLRRIESITSGGGDPFADWDLRELSREARTSARYLPAVIQAERLVAGLSTTNSDGHRGGGIKAEVEQQVEAMDRSQLEAYLLGREEHRTRPPDGRPPE